MILFGVNLWLKPVSVTWASVWPERLCYVFQVGVCRPDGVYLCDGSPEEAEEITQKMVCRGMLETLPAMDNW